MPVANLSHNRPHFLRAPHLNVECFSTWKLLRPLQVERVGPTQETPRRASGEREGTNVSGPCEFSFFITLGPLKDRHEISTGSLAESSQSLAILPPKLRAWAK